MNLLAVLFILLNIGAVAGPAAAVAVIHMDNPVEMIIPPQVQDIVTNTLNTQDFIEMPQYVSSDYDLATKTITAVFSFKNPFEVDLTINQLSAQIQCTDHSFSLGNANLNNPLTIKPQTTGLITIVFAYTQTAQTHFQTAHPQATNMDITLTDLQVDVSGIEIQTPQTIQINVPLQE